MPTDATIAKLREELRAKPVVEAVKPKRGKRRNLTKSLRKGETITVGGHPVTAAKNSVLSFPPGVPVDWVGKKARGK